jgi:hypothetical protein
MRARCMGSGTPVSWLIAVPGWRVPRCTSGLLHRVAFHRVGDAIGGEGRCGTTAIAAPITTESWAYPTRLFASQTGLGLLPAYRRLSRTDRNSTGINLGQVAAAVHAPDMAATPMTWRVDCGCHSHGARGRLKGGARSKVGLGTTTSGDVLGFFAHTHSSSSRGAERRRSVAEPRSPARTGVRC